MFLADRQGFSQRDLAAKAKLNSNTISDWCMGKTSPDRRSMDSVLRVLGCTEQVVEEATAIFREWRLRPVAAALVEEGPGRYAAADDIHRELGRIVARLVDLIGQLLQRKPPSPPA
ncbi:MAG TPA: helix-turn-helix transcriptional regulator [Thermoanaerobaculia bacterium]|nr:helix-turn-helix transcriptional regulator [Thermoanaerobaculia bacterium]